MRRNQLLLRIIVFGFVALDTSGAGVVLGVAIGIAVGVVNAAVSAIANRKWGKEDDAELD